MSDALRIDEFDKNGSYTYADYLKWDGPERYQLINGEVFMMASPSVAHQAILMELSVKFGSWLQGKTCQVFAAPLDVRLFPREDKTDNTVVQPDLLVVCDNKKLSKGSVNGAPDLIIEIISPSNTHSGLFYKFQHYLKAEVREYWVIDPEGKTIHVHIFDNGRYISTIYEGNARIPVSILPGLEIALEELWVRVSI
ncbi:MAG: Uma2 family endonuclease [Treponema sp.]|nr:Uma2 family endonuclease [Treponema sp.]